MCFLWLWLYLTWIGKQLCLWKQQSRNHCAISSTDNCSFCDSYLPWLRVCVCGCCVCGVWCVCVVCVCVCVCGVWCVLCVCVCVSVVSVVLLWVCVVCCVCVSFWAKILLMEYAHIAAVYFWYRCCFSSEMTSTTGFVCKLQLEFMKSSNCKNKAWRKGIVLYVFFTGVLPVFRIAHVIALCFRVNRNMREVLIMLCNELPAFSQCSKLG